MRLALSPALGLALLALTLATACAKPEASARIPADWSVWRRTTALKLDYPIPGHNDAFRVIRANAVAFAPSRRAENGRSRIDFAPGSIVVKEIYAENPPPAGAKPISLYYMVKSPADEAARGGWVWGTVDLASGVQRDMPGGFCAGCHANANEPYPYADRNPDSEFRDFVFFPPGLAGADPSGYP